MKTTEQMSHETADQKSAIVYVNLTSADAVLEVFRETFRKVASIKYDQVGGRCSIEVTDRGSRVQRSVFELPKASGTGIHSLPKKFAVHYVFDPIFAFVMGLWAFRSIHSRIDVFVGSSWSYTLAGLVLRKLGVVRSVIYWAVDWFPAAMSDEMHNTRSWTMNLALMRTLDKICYERSNQVWNLTDKLGEKRRAWWGSRLKLKDERVVYHVMREKNQHEVQNDGEKRKLRNGVAFVGRLWPGRGLELTIEALDLLRRNNLVAVLNISAPEEKNNDFLRDLIAFARRKGVHEQLKIWGFVPDNELSSFLGGCLAGLALSESEDDNSNIIFPGKVVLYLEQGLPVIVSSNSSLAGLVKDEGIGLVVDWTPESLATAFSRLLDESQSLLLANGVKKFIGEESSKSMMLDALRAATRS